MLNFWKKLFNKPEVEDDNANDPAVSAFDTANNEHVHFVLYIDSLVIGYLKLEDGLWIFNYSEDFKQQKKYHRLVGFPLLDKVYKSEVLWPFFKIRIPGLKQPMIKEIIEKEKINSKSELELLKRFGGRSVSNPYLLKPQYGH
jgi:HipA-like protein